jgi:hypothetical protein
MSSADRNRLMAVVAAAIARAVRSAPSGAAATAPPSLFSLASADAAQGIGPVRTADPKDPSNPNNSLSPLEMYLIWKGYWQARDAVAQPRREKLEDAIRSKDPVEFVDRMLMFRAGRRDALGPEYEAAAAESDLCSAQLSVLEEMLRWLEARHRAGESVTLGQVNERALSTAKSRGIFVDIAMTALLFGYPKLTVGGRPPVPRSGPPAGKPSVRSGEAVRATGEGPHAIDPAKPARPGPPARVPDMLDLQQANALRDEARALQARAADVEQDAQRAAQRGRSDRAATLRQHAQEHRQQAAARSARAEEYESGRRSARAELPTPDDFGDFFAGTDQTVGDFAHSGKLSRIQLGAGDRNPQSLLRLSRELMTSRAGGRVVYRVDGGNARTLLRVDSAGNVTVAPGQSMHLNFGSPERAYEFLSKATKGGAGGRLVRFEVSEEWVRSLRSAAVPEAAGAPERGPTGRVPRQPQLVDVKYADDQIMVPGALTSELQKFIVPGSGSEAIVDELKAPH